MKIEIIESKRFNQIATLVEEVQNLHAALFPTVYKPYQREEIEKAIDIMLADEKCRVFIATSDKETIGYIVILIKEIPESAFHYSFKLLHINQIAVFKTNQHGGVGTILMNKAEEIAKELSINRLELDHLDINLNAATFFKRKGFNPYRSKLFKQLT